MALDSLGLIGLGLLGSAMAERFAAARFTVLGYDIDTAKGQLTSAREAAEAGSIVILSLPNSETVMTVVEEIEPALRSGQVVIDTTTGDPEIPVILEQRLRARGVALLDAAIAGSSEQLRRGEVNVLVGGTAEAVSRAQPVFASFAQHVFHVGPCGSGTRMKLVSNLVLGLNRAVLAEGLAFASTLGIDGKTALDILKTGSTYSRVMDLKGDRMLQQNYEPEARLSQHLKDVRLMLKTGTTSGCKLPLTALHAELLEEAERLGFGAHDNSAVMEVFRGERSSP